MIQTKHQLTIFESEEQDPARAKFPYDLATDLEQIGYSTVRAIGGGNRSGADLLFYGYGISGIIGLGVNEQPSSNRLLMNIFSDNPRTQEQQEALDRLIANLSVYLPFQEKKKGQRESDYSFYRFINKHLSLFIGHKMKLFGKIFKGNTLYYPGCLTKVAAKDIENNYKEILKKCGIEFIQLSDIEVCCGKPIFNSGHKAEAKELAEKNFKVFKDHSVSRIITSCPACYHMFSKEYPELVKGWDIEVEFMTKIMNEAIKQGKLKPNKINSSITYHDPCHFSRVFYYHDEPREVIKSTGAEIKEMKLTKNYAFCCGAGSGVKTNYPEIAASVGKERLKMARETKADILTTPCPMCYMHFKENNSEAASKLKVMELSQLFIENQEGEKK